MAAKCIDCKGDLITVQAYIPLGVTEAGKPTEFPVLAGVCPSCGRMDLSLATPKQFGDWVKAQQTEMQAAGDSDKNDSAIYRPKYPQ